VNRFEKYRWFIEVIDEVARKNEIVSRVDGFEINGVTLCKINCGKRSIEFKFFERYFFELGDVAFLRDEVAKILMVA